MEEKNKIQRNTNKQQLLMENKIEKIGSNGENSTPRADEGY
jgi:hypothetical protein